MLHYPAVLFFIRILNTLIRCLQTSEISDAMNLFGTFTPSLVFRVDQLICCCIDQRDETQETKRNLPHQPVTTVILHIISLLWPGPTPLRAQCSSYNFCHQRDSCAIKMISVLLWKLYFYSTQVILQKGMSMGYDYGLYLV